MHIRLLPAAAAIGLAVTLGMAPAGAATPANMVVMAWQIDELISLDPAEIYEFVGGELSGNLYDRIVFYDIKNPDQMQGGAAESWTVSSDGKTFTFKIRDGIKFQSGNPLTAEDAAWSLQRLVKLDKGPAFILKEFGLSKDNVDQKVRATDAKTLVFETDKAYAPTFVLNCLGSWVSSVLDKKTVMANEKNGDFGNDWLKTHAAGSGPYKVGTLRQNEVIMLDAFEDYWRGAPKMKRVALRHVPESAPQRLMLEKGDADIARNLAPDDLDVLAKNPDITIRKVPQGMILYLGLNQKNQYLSKPEVTEALKWLVDYEGIEKAILRGTRVPHQTFLPEGYLGAINDKPYTLNVEKAKALLAKAGLSGGFKLTMDTRNTYPTMDIAQVLQATWAKAGIQLEIIPGDNKQTLTKYRARQHDIYIGQWAPDYLDPHSNAQGFAWNPDNSDNSSNKLLAWRNAWDIPQYTKMTEAALAESDPAKRKAIYEQMQRDFLKVSPYVIMFQNVQVLAERKNVKGFEHGPNFDVVYYRNITK